LALGAPLGAMAWGGKQVELTEVLRNTSFMAAGIFFFAVLVVLERLGKIHPWRKPKITGSFLWLFGFYLLFNAALNFLAGGGMEKMFMAPLAALAGLLTFVVAKAEPL